MGDDDIKSYVLLARPGCHEELSSVLYIVKDSQSCIICLTLTFRCLVHFSSVFPK